MEKYDSDILDKVKALEEVFWVNRNKIDAEKALNSIEMKYEDILEAEALLIRFQPLIKTLFPETLDGIIESPLTEIDRMKKKLEDLYDTKIHGRLFLKCDSHLKIAGSVKARGGIYEVLKHAEELAIKNGLIAPHEDYSVFASESFRKFFSSYKIAVGSTGNLGLSIGIMSSALGFEVTVHMSKEAKEWKKSLLRSKGVRVIEYDYDYSKAVEGGRLECMKDPRAHFIDDENSKELFLGYSVAALRLARQLKDKDIIVDERHKLIVYLPCGVGGAPGGISFGLRNIFKDNVIIYFVEPTHSPCMLLGLLTQRFNNVHVNDYGIDNITEADGLAVGSPSRLVSIIADKIIDGIYTMKDLELFMLLAGVKDSENIKIEPSACLALKGPVICKGNKDTVHIAWATGGLLLPKELYDEMYKKGIDKQ